MSPRQPLILDAVDAASTDAPKREDRQRRDHSNRKQAYAKVSPQPQLEFAQQIRANAEHGERHSNRPGDDEKVRYGARLQGIRSRLSNVEKIVSSANTTRPVNTKTRRNPREPK